MRLPFLREAITRMQGYVPGEQPDAGAVKLNTNENPHAPSPHVLEAIHRTLGDAARRYPDPLCSALRADLAEAHGLAPENLFVANGSDEVLRLLAHLTLDPGDRLGMLEPTYSLYEVLAALFAALPRGHRVPEDGRLPRSLFMGQERALFIANPNPPFGTLCPLSDIAELCARRRDALVVVDEAYIAFAPEGASAIALLADNPNLVVTRTFSKSHQLAGLRVGYALGHRETIAGLMKIKDSYNVNAVSQAAARAALRDVNHFERTRDAILAERRRLADELTRRGFDVPPSHGNFLFARHPRAPEIFTALREQRVFVRWFDRPATRLGLRITVGLPDQTDALLRALDTLPTVTAAAQSGR